MSEPGISWVRRVAALAASLGCFWLVAVRFDLKASEPASRLSARERDEVLATLSLFQKIYTDIHVTGGAPALIDEFPATKGIKHRVFREIGFLRSAGLVQVLDLAQSVPISVERNGDGRVEAVCYEEWNHVVQRAGSRDPVSRPRGMGAGFRYLLQREGARWIVAAWDPVEVEPPAQTTGRLH